MAVPSNAPAGSVGAQPLASGLSLTDYLLGWQPALFPASSVLVQNSQIVALDHSLSPVTASGTSSTATLAAWTGMLAGAVSGFVLSSGAINNTSVAATTLGVTGTTTLGNGLANYLTLAGATTGNGPTITAAGSDTNIYVRAIPKGAGKFEALTATFGTANGSANLFTSTTALGVTVNPTYSTTVNAGFAVIGSYGGTVTSGQAFFNAIVANSDVVDPTSGPGGAALLYIGHTISTGAKGGRTTLEVLLNQNGTTNLTGPDPYYVAFSPSSWASASAGGVSGTPAGNMQVMNPILKLKTGAGLYWNGLGVAEFDIAFQTGTAAVSKRGILIVQTADDAVQGSLHDAAFLFVNQPSGTAPGWKTLIQVGGYEGWFPGDTTNGAIINTEAATIGGGPSYALKYGIKIDGITFGTSAFQSNGFLVDGSGNATVATLVSATDNAIMLTSQTSGGASGAGTLSNAPSAGNPNFWLPITINGTTRYVPAW